MIRNFLIKTLGSFYFSFLAVLYHAYLVGVHFVLGIFCIAMFFVQFPLYLLKHLCSEDPYGDSWGFRPFVLTGAVSTILVGTGLLATHNSGTLDFVNKQVTSLLAPPSAEAIAKASGFGGNIAMHLLLSGAATGLFLGIFVIIAILMIIFYGAFSNLFCMVALILSFVFSVYTMTRHYSMAAYFMHTFKMALKPFDRIPYHFHGVIDHIPKCIPGFNVTE